MSLPEGFFVRELTWSQRDSDLSNLFEEFEERNSMWQKSCSQIYEGYEDRLSGKFCGNMRARAFKTRSQQFTLRFHFDGPIPKGLVNMRLNFYVMMMGSRFLCTWTEKLIVLLILLVVITIYIFRIFDDNIFATCRNTNEGIRAICAR